MPLYLLVIRYGRPWSGGSSGEVPAAEAVPKGADSLSASSSVLPALTPTPSKVCYSICHANQLAEVCLGKERLHPLSFPASPTK